MASEEDNQQCATARWKVALHQSLKKLSTRAHDYYLSHVVTEINGPPSSALHFYRDWVAFNRPVIFRQAAKHWPAFTKWQDNEYFRRTLGHLRMTVAITPNGYADAVLNDKFVMPHEESMTMDKFLDVIDNPDVCPGAVHYIQKQNSNLSDELELLQGDVEEPMWAREAFGKSPDATNFWLGDGRAITSTHKDPYENIYCVVRGFKDFILFPPSDLPWLRHQDCVRAKYVYSGHGTFSIEEVPIAAGEASTIPWIVVDPLRPDVERFPEYLNATPLHCRLHAGDVLYLPSLWFHHLQQSHGCVAVNFWYDMEFDSRWNHFQLLSDLSSLMRLQP